MDFVRTRIQMLMQTFLNCIKKIVLETKTTFHIKYA